MDETSNNALSFEDGALSEDTIAAIDADWDEDVPAENTEDQTEAEESTDAQPEETEATEESAAEPEGSPDSAKPDTEESAEEPKGDEGNQLFTLKFLGQEKTVSRDEMIELAQKGANYDHVLNERNALKEEQHKFKAYESFLKELAEGSGMEIDALMENTRARMLISEANARREELSEEDAVTQVRQRMKEQEAKAVETEKAEKAAEAAENAEQTPPEVTAEEKQRQAFAEFIAEYPDVDPKSIPHEVWAEYGSTGDLVGPYRKYEIKQLRSENEKLKQNEKNKQRSTGSRRTSGGKTPQDEFDALWYDGT